MSLKHALEVGSALLTVVGVGVAYERHKKGASVTPPPAVPTVNPLPAPAPAPGPAPALPAGTASTVGGGILADGGDPLSAGGAGDTYDTPTGGGGASTDTSGSSLLDDGSAVDDGSSLLSAAADLL